MVGSRGLQFQQLRKWLRTVQTEYQGKSLTGDKGGGFKASGEPLYLQKCSIPRPGWGWGVSTQGGFSVNTDL